MSSGLVLEISLKVSYEVTHLAMIGVKGGMGGVGGGGWGGYARCARAARATPAPLTSAGITRILCARGRSSLRYDGCAARHLMIRIIMITVPHGIL